MKRALTIAGGLPIAAILLNFAACSSSDPKPSLDASTNGEGAAPAITSYRQPVEAGSNEGILFGEAGAPAACSARPTPKAELVRACVLRTSCIPDEPPYTISECLSQNRVAGDDNAACVIAAPTCNAMNDCLDQGFNTKECKFGDHGFNCYDDVIISCDNTPRSYHDCKKAGKQCFLDKEDASTTSFPCIGDLGSPPFPDPAVDCSLQNHSAACFTETVGPLPSDAGFGEGGAKDAGASTKKSWAIYCQFGATLGIDCTSLGKTCVPYAAGAECRNANGEGDCLPAPDGGVNRSSSCSGSSLVTCNGRKETRDCAASGLKCISADDRADCLLPGCTVEDAEKCQESCDGPYANVCVGGGRHVIDCRDYGFRRCQAYTSRSEKYEGDYAVCVLF